MHADLKGVVAVFWSFAALRNRRLDGVTCRPTGCPSVKCHSTSIHSSHCQRSPVLGALQCLRLKCSDTLIAIQQHYTSAHQPWYVYNMAMYIVPIAALTSAPAALVLTPRCRTSAHCSNSNANATMRSEPGISSIASRRVQPAGPAARAAAMQLCPQPCQPPSSAV